jgi:membrane complex biogenesis BtpA family protein
LKPLLQSSNKILIGVVHLKPLPGSPRWAGDLKKVILAAVADARAYESGGTDAICIENFGDVPFTKGSVTPETIGAMAAATCEIRKTISLPIGFNVLRNDARAALGLCAACGGSFIRVNIHTGAMLTDQGIIEGNAYETLRARRQLCPNVQILADVHVKHAVPLGNASLIQSAADTLERGLADALILSGQATGKPADANELLAVRRAFPSAHILLGSGVTLRNLDQFRTGADGFIVGTSLKIAGRVENPVDRKRVAVLARAVHRS